MREGYINQRGRRATSHGGEGFRPDLDFSRKVKVKKNQEVAAQRASDVSLAKQLKYAKWPIKPIVFRTIEIASAIGSCILAAQVVGPIIQVLALFGGRILVKKLLARAIERRSDHFDRDYAQFLLSVVGLLKTGMNPIQAIAAAAEGMEGDSLLRFEAELMLERMRCGVSEDASVGSFAGDILHPEVELFVQALLLSRRVGGNLSETLERLARQVRKRQQFRGQARSAVSMQRGSVFVIVFIMGGLGLFISLTNPSMVKGLLASPEARFGAEMGVACICFAIYWVGKITKIRT